MSLPVPKVRPRLLANYESGWQRSGARAPSSNPQDCRGGKQADSPPTATLQASIALNAVSAPPSSAIRDLGQFFDNSRRIHKAACPAHGQKSETPGIDYRFMRFRTPTGSPWVLRRTDCGPSEFFTDQEFKRLVTLKGISYDTMAAWPHYNLDAIK